MKLINQPNSWSCAVAAAAMIFDREIKEIIDCIGHDGSEVIASHLPPPACFKGFHIQEIVDVAYIFNYAMTPIEARPVQTPDGEFEYEIKTWGMFGRNSVRRFNYYFKETRGLLVGKARQFWHTVAYEYGTIFDPRGRIHKSDDCKIQVQSLWIVSENQII